MSIALAKSQLIEVVQGRSVAEGEKLYSLGIAVEPTQIKGGELFVAVSPQTAPEALKAAFERGASLAVVNDRVMAEGSSFPERCVIVDDPTRALLALAQWWRAQHSLPCVAICGGNGKTTVKELIATLLLRRAVGAYSLGDRGDAVNLALSLCRISSEHRWAAVEAAVTESMPSVLLPVAQPSVALLLPAGDAHEVELVTQISAACVPGSSIILNRDDSNFTALEAVPRERGVNVLSFGREESSRCRILAVQDRGLDGITVTLQSDTDTIEVKSVLVGEFNAYNLAAAVACARSVMPDLGANEIVSALSRFRAPAGRLERKSLRGGRTLLDDSYSADPASMSAALHVIGDLRKGGARVGLVLGGMTVTPQKTEELHRVIGKRLAEIKPAFLVAVGEDAKLYGDEAKKAGIPVFEARAADYAAHVLAKLVYDVVLIKGARGMQLDKTAEMLFDREGAPLKES